ncbi:uncharacterized protein GGS25DRAFT_492071 [Hypoxylon fragiforme]|uniref:uncharacterized protein n=1 Tax=Hypoxylon fragiforme TaxID=63214 RepID=UPI0020C6F187|nr:uncharacterized protein GGS25DRAFT_492071 [Hypoxylon fragiforme]KAI2608910.1 hypothetical protein GGS25DRAFT_492071 [Hypoxylon fragiforme]
MAFDHPNKRWEACPMLYQAARFYGMADLADYVLEFQREIMKATALKIQVIYYERCMADYGTRNQFLDNVEEGMDLHDLMLGIHLACESDEFSPLQEAWVDFCQATMFWILSVERFDGFLRQTVPAFRDRVLDKMDPRDGPDYTPERCKDCRENPFLRDEGHWVQAWDMGFGIEGRCDQCGPELPLFK